MTTRRYCDDNNDDNDDVGQRRGTPTRKANAGLKLQLTCGAAQERTTTTTEYMYLHDNDNDDKKWETMTKGWGQRQTTNNIVADLDIDDNQIDNGVRNQGIYYHRGQR